MDVLVGRLPAAPADLPLPLAAGEHEARERGMALVLDEVDGRLALRAPGGRERPLVVDFTSGRQGYRLAADRVRHERLLKAMGGMPDQERTVLDFTAGLGRDALVLAQAGFRVVMFERSPVVHALLADGLRRLAASDPALAASLALHEGDVLEREATLPEAFGVLLDPMFPERERKAAVKKELQWLQWLAPVPDAAEEARLLTLARRHAGRRVVVKRALRAPALAGVEPSFTVAGRAARFDVYLAPAPR